MFKVQNLWEFKDTYKVNPDCCYVVLGKAIILSIKKAYSKSDQQAWLSNVGVSNNDYFE